MKIKTHILFALGYFTIIAFLGTLLRLFFVTEIPLKYKHIVHAHSHIALLGWVYTALTTLIYFCYLKENAISKKYKILFWSTQFTLIGMLISFPITGYALYSIIFSSLFLIVSYWFFWFVAKHTSKEQKSSNSYTLIYAGLWFMVISSIGPWALGIIMNTLGNTSIWYKNAIYFYLYFQYNGWFIVSLFGIFFYVLEKQNIYFSKKDFSTFYKLLLSSVVLTFFISVLWTKPSIIYNILSGIGAILQIVAFVFLVILLKQKSAEIKSSFSPFVLQILKITSLLFILKMMMQLLGSIPYFSNLIATHIEFAIGYLHWTFIGVVSISLFGFLHLFKLIHLSKKAFQFYMIGFVLTEVLLFYKGITHWLNTELVASYYLLLVVASFMLLIAIGIIFLSQFRNKKITEVW